MTMKMTMMKGEKMSRYVDRQVEGNSFHHWWLYRSGLGKLCSRNMSHHQGYTTDCLWFDFATGSSQFALNVDDIQFSGSSRPSVNDSVGNVCIYVHIPNPHPNRSKKAQTLFGFCVSLNISIDHGSLDETSKSSSLYLGPWTIDETYMYNFGLSFETWSMGNQI